MFFFISKIGQGSTKQKLFVVEFSRHIMEFCWINLLKLIKTLQQLILSIFLHNNDLSLF